jgi:hypothetical protein
MQNRFKQELSETTPLPNNSLETKSASVQRKLNAEELRKANSFNISAVPRYTFFKRTLKRYNRDYLPIITFILASPIVTAPLLLFYPIPASVIAARATVYRKKPQWSGEQVFQILEKLKKLDEEKFNLFFTVFFLKLHQTHMASNPYSKLNSLLEKMSKTSFSDRLILLEEYLQDPGNYDSRLYNLLIRAIDDNIPDHENIIQQQKPRI